ncbi:MAG: hypothetical protein RMA76_22905 [Deltaproteobacteria bacterium]|jgi:hypothetical protein
MSTNENKNANAPASKLAYEAPAIVEHDLLLDVTAQSSSSSPTTPAPTPLPE